MCHRAFGGQPLVSCPLNFSVLFNFFFSFPEGSGIRPQKVMLQVKLKVTPAAASDITTLSRG